MRRRTRACAIVFSLSLVLVSSGCRAQPEEPAVTPLVTPPVVATAGVLRAGIDFDYPPYGGADEGERAGLDLDIAAALADKLGLKLEVVDVPPSEGQQALDSDSIDVIMSATLGDSPVEDVSVAGTYLSTAPGLFGRVDADASAEPSLTVDTIGDRTVVVQKESETYWLLDGVYGQDYASPVDTLRDGFEAVAAERASLVAGDTIVGAYMARDFEGIGFVGQLAPATPIGVGVAQDNPELNDAVRQALDELATDGVLDAVRTKWVGDLPELRIAEESDV